MNKIKLIIAREYLTRVKKRSFIIMTILGPILMAAIFVVPVYLAQLDDKSEKSIAVIDETGLFFNKFENDEQQKFYQLDKDIEVAKLEFSDSEDYALLYIPEKKLNLPTQAMLYSDIQPNMNLKSYIERVMSKEIEEQKLILQIDKLSLNEAQKDIAFNIPEAIKTKIVLSTIKLGEEGDSEQKTYAEVAMIVGGLSGLMIYFFIFIFGAQIMRGVIEEKTNRIIEVIVSSVKPFQIMMGKIIGLALVGLTQLLLWVVLTTGIVSVVQAGFMKDLKPLTPIENTNNQLVPNNNPVEMSDTAKIMEKIGSVDFILVILTFAFYFLGGYLFYAALFAAVGSAVDNETDTQQFMMPITIPLILSIVMAQFVINNPDGPVAFWMSMIPFTSPIIMMVRIPFGVPGIELAASMALLIIGFIATTWLAARIYRIGILMYGKKPTYKELWKWVRYKG